MIRLGRVTWLSRNTVGGGRQRGKSGPSVAPVRKDMHALRLLMLVVVLVLAYLLVLRPQTRTADDQGSRSSHSQYKESMDRANAAAKQMKDQRAEADSL